MRYLRDAESIPHPGIRGLVRQRIAELSQDNPFDPDTMGLLCGQGWSGVSAPFQPAFPVSHTEDG